jgi:ABC-2 type transport system permease protein
MTTHTMRSRMAGLNRDSTHPSLSLGLQVWLITRQNLVTIFRRPAAVLPPIAISLFFLVIYNSTLGEASGFIPRLGSNSYLGFILPLSVVSSSLSGAGIAAQNLVRGLESGYFDKLLLTPINRSALLTGAVLGLLALLGLSVLLGLGFAGFTISAALGSGNAAVTQSAGFIFFPLTFLAPTFVPLELLSGWLKAAARLNPITYVLEAMRALLNTGWDSDLLLRGLLACLLLGFAMYLLTLYALRVRTRRV